MWAAVDTALSRGAASPRLAPSDCLACLSSAVCLITWTACFSVHVCAVHCLAARIQGCCGLNMCSFGGDRFGPCDLLGLMSPVRARLVLWSFTGIAGLLHSTGGCQAAQAFVEQQGEISQSGPDAFSPWAEAADCLGVLDGAEESAGKGHSMWPCPQQGLPSPGVWDTSWLCHPGPWHPFLPQLGTGQYTRE